MTPLRYDVTTSFTNFLKAQNMTTITDNNPDFPVIRTYFYFSDYELALVTMPDMNNDVVTYTSTGGLGGVEHKDGQISITEIFGRETIPLTQEAMMQHHEKILESKKFIAFIEKLRHSPHP